MKKAALIVILVALAGVFIYRSNVESEEQLESIRKQISAPYEQEKALEKKGEDSMRQQCTNILGWQRTVDFSFDGFDTNVEKWKGYATIDFVNQMGGVQRTNLIFKFKKLARDFVYCEVDYEEMNRLESNALAWVAASEASNIMRVPTQSIVASIDLPNDPPIDPALAAKKKFELETKALAYNLEKANAGDPYNQFRMGERYRDGDGVAKDPLAARAWFTKASANGYAGATIALSKLR